MEEKSKSISGARPFLKWAGGKTQLLREFAERLPSNLDQGKLTNYVEPFIGGGAVYFFLNQKYSFQHCYICDVNEELILAYRVIQRSVDELVSKLEILELNFLSRNNKEREKLFYEIRNEFNRNLREINFKKFDPTWIDRTAQIIFLNRTCYNGLFRVNRKGEFNVPFGRYKNPEILNEENLRYVASLLKSTAILLGDFTLCRKYVNQHTFVYFDPPYRPLNQTSSFTSYSKDGFSDSDQMRLVKFFKELDAKGAKIMLSNSDPKNENPNDTFFDDLFSDYYIERVHAKRMINCNGSRRGDINELIITNYPTEKSVFKI